MERLNLKALKKSDEVFISGVQHIVEETKKETIDGIEILTVTLSCDRERKYYRHLNYQNQITL